MLKFYTGSLQQLKEAEDS